MREPLDIARDLKAEVKTPNQHPRIAIPDALQRFDKSDTRGQFLNAEELSFFTEAFKDTGLPAASTGIGI